MHLPLIQTSNRELQQHQTQWKAILDSVASNPILAGRQINGIALVSGNNTINTGLDRALQGYIITSMSGAYVDIYQVSSPNPTLTLVLNSTGAATIGLWVY